MRYRARPDLAARSRWPGPSRGTSEARRSGPSPRPSSRPHAGTAPVSGVSLTATYTRAYAESNGFLTLLSDDGERLTGAYALGPEAGEWLQQATLAIRARVPVEVWRDTIQPFPTFSGIYIEALKALHAQITGAASASVGSETA